MVKVKICGITNKEDALKAVKLGAWTLGFIFYRKSPRYISSLKVKRILDHLPLFVIPVGVFVNEDVQTIKKICQKTDIRVVQLHGDESPQICRQLKEFKVIKAIRIKEESDLKGFAKYPVDAFLFDTYHKDVYGGSGEVFNWNILKKSKINKPFILSGGLSPKNLMSAYKKVKPFAFDVSSGVESSPGVKDHKLMKKLFDIVYRLDAGG